MAKFDRLGQRVATTLFEAAAWHYAVKPVCRCSHFATFNPHGLWWYFEKRRLDDRLLRVQKYFWCRKCGERIGQRIRPVRIDLVAETDTDICLALPPMNEWKRAVSRFRS